MGGSTREQEVLDTLSRGQPPTDPTPPTVESEQNVPWRRAESPSSQSTAPLGGPGGTLCRDLVPLHHTGMAGSYCGSEANEDGPYTLILHII